MRITYENRNQIMEFKMSNEQLHEMRQSQSVDLVRAFLETIYRQVDVDVEQFYEEKHPKNK